MVGFGSLWLPIVLSAVGVWFASFLIWAVLPWHKKDYGPVADEPAARHALKGLSPGLYNIPNVTGGWSDLKNPEVTKLFDEGPIGFMTILPSGVPKMGKPMIQSIVYYLVVAVIVAYLAGRTLGPGVEYLTVFRIAGTTAWLAHGLAVIPDSIWFGRPWRFTFKILLDALVYGLLTAGFFAGFWPAA